MKKLVGVLVCVSTLMSCNIQQVGKHLSDNININAKRSSSNKAISEDESDDFDHGGSQYIAEELVQCMMAQATAPENTDTTFEVLEINQEMINAVKADIASYVKKKGKIAPGQFWSILKQSTIELLNYELIKKYSALNEAQFLAKQGQLAYAFIYLLETGGKNIAYILNSDPEKKVKDKIVFGENAQKTIALGICNKPELKEIPVTYSINDTSLVQCSGIKHDTMVRMKITLEENFELFIKTKRKLYKIQLELRDIELEARKKHNLISYNLGINSNFKVKLNKSGNKLESLKFKLNRASKIKLSNFKCRTFAPFEFE